MQNEVTSFARLNAKKQKIDLSDYETRDLTREEMLDINKQNEEIMNMELQMMTIFSVVLSLPIFYLCWVAFYSD
jgi:selenocysteine-specific elongation factor